MPDESVEALRQYWEALVQEHFRARRMAELAGASPEALERLDWIHTVRIDTAYAEMKISESLDVLKATLAEARRVRSRVHY